ncbi:cyclase family protein [Moorella naiadis]|uniref:cyclase family protein n=1 Tax=Moorella naiadis (nom. illeg.) TaxID=3093670 RepID=UPI003D9CA22D
MLAERNPIDALNEVISKFNFIDLSPVLEKGIPRWPTHPYLVIDQTVTHEHDGYYSQTLNMAEHTGAHVDAPAHIHPHMMENTIDKVPVNYLIAPAVVYNLESLGLSPGEQARAADILILEDEMKTGSRAGDVVLLRFGWQKYWRTDKMWKWYAENAPGLDESAVKLLAERNIRAVGSDTIACDQAIKDGQAAKSYGHDVYWLPNHILILEGLMNLEKLPPRCYFLALPLNIKNGSGSPIRPVALVPKEE